jgi:calcium-dependent protein kinase
VRFKLTDIGKLWDNTSKEAKDLIKKMLTYNPKTRISAAEAYQHDWFKGKETHALETARVRELASNINQFYVNPLTNLKSIGKLQQAAMMFITTQLMSRKEKDNLTAIFLSLDKNGDGTLTKEELMEGYTRLHGNNESARIEVESLMDIADVDHNGTIDYSEFLLAAANKQKLISKANVKQAFDLFDIVRKNVMCRIRAVLYQLMR